MTTPKKKAHQTQSFEQLVAKASLERLKPFIQQQVQLQGHVITQKVARIVLDPISQLQTRQMALEQVLEEALGASLSGLTDKIANKICVLEDNALGLHTVEEAAEGDTVRLSVESKEEGKEVFTHKTKLRIERLLVKNAEDRVQTFQELEESVVGTKVGESKELVLRAEENAPATVVRYTLERASRKTVEEVKGGGDNAEV